MTLKFRIFFYGGSWWLHDPHLRIGWKRCESFDDALKKMDDRLRGMHEVRTA